MLNVIDRQKKMFRQDNARPHATDFLTTLMYCHDPQIRGFEMNDTKKQVHVCVAGSKLVQHKIFLVEFRVGEVCYP
jgi:hypothetical protein